jgi:hypothetical protein
VGRNTSQMKVWFPCLDDLYFIDCKLHFRWIPKNRNACSGNVWFGWKARTSSLWWMRLARHIQSMHPIPSVNSKLGKTSCTKVLIQS